MKLSSSSPFKSTLKAPGGSSPFGGAKKKTPVPVKSSTKPAKVKITSVSDDLYDETDLDDQIELETSRSPVLALTGSLSSSLPSCIKVETLLDESDTDDNKDRWKNMRANTNTMAVPTVLNTQASQKQIRGLTTLFGQRASVILNLLEDDSQTDGALTLIQRTLLQTMVDILPVVERDVRTSRGKHGVYQLNQCISQIRELTTDIQSLRDRGQLGASVVERSLRPAYLDLAVQISLAITEIDNSAKSIMKSEDHTLFRSETLIPMKRSLATFVQQQYETIKEDVTAGLS